MSDLPVMSFDIKEKVKLSKEEHNFNELSSIELEPVIKINTHEKQVDISGYLVVYGEFYINNRFFDDDLDHFDALHFDSTINDSTIDSFQYRIPIAIKIDSNRVDDATKVMVDVESFDYEVLSSQELELTATVNLTGVKSEVVQSANTANANTTKFEKKQEKSDLERENQVRENKVRDNNESPIHSLIKKEEKQEKQDLIADEKYPDIFAKKSYEEVKEKDNADNKIVDNRVESAEKLEKVDEVLNTASTDSDEYSDEAYNEEEYYNEEEVVEETNKDKSDTKAMLYGLLNGDENNQYKMKMYIVQKEDTIDGIASDYGITTTEIINRNNLRDTNLLMGQILFLPIR